MGGNDTAAQRMLPHGRASRRPSSGSISAGNIRRTPGAPANAVSRQWRGQREQPTREKNTLDVLKQARSLTDNVLRKTQAAADAVQSQRYMHSRRSQQMRREVTDQINDQTLSIRDSERFAWEVDDAINRTGKCLTRMRHERFARSAALKVCERRWGLQQVQSSNLQGSRIEGDCDQLLEALARERSVLGEVKRELLSSEGAAVQTLDGLQAIREELKKSMGSRRMSMHANHVAHFGITSSTPCLPRPSVPGTPAAPGSPGAAGDWRVARNAKRIQLEETECYSKQVQEWIRAADLQFYREGSQKGTQTDADDAPKDCGAPGDGEATGTEEQASAEKAADPTTATTLPGGETTMPKTLSYSSEDAPKNELFDLHDRAADLIRCAEAICDRGQCLMTWAQNESAAATTKASKQLTQHADTTGKLAKTLRRESVELGRAIQMARRTLVQAGSRLKEQDPDDLVQQCESAHTLLEELQASKNDLDEDLRLRIASLNVDQVCLKMTPQAASIERLQVLPTATISGSEQAQGTAAERGEGAGNARRIRPQSAPALPRLIHNREAARAAAPAPLPQGGSRPGELLLRPPSVGPHATRSSDRNCMGQSSPSAFPRPCSGAAGAAAHAAPMSSTGGCLDDDYPMCEFCSAWPT